MKTSELRDIGNIDTMGGMDQLTNNLRYIRISRKHYIFMHVFCLFVLYWSIGLCQLNRILDTPPNTHPHGKEKRKRKRKTKQPNTTLYLLNLFVGQH